jgi:hypothetical protein
MASDIIENLDLEKPSFGPSKWPQKLKPAKNSKLPKWPENYFEPIGKGGWPLISTWINPVHILKYMMKLRVYSVLICCKLFQFQQVRSASARFTSNFSIHDNLLYEPFESGIYLFRRRL